MIAVGERDARDEECEESERDASVHLRRLRTRRARLAVIGIRQLRRSGCGNEGQACRIRRGRGGTIASLVSQLADGDQLDAARQVPLVSCHACTVVRAACTIIRGGEGKSCKAVRRPTSGFSGCSGLETAAISAAPSARSSRRASPGRAELPPRERCRLSSGVSVSGVPGVSSMFRLCSGCVPGIPSMFRLCSGCSVDVSVISAPSHLRLCHDLPSKDHSKQKEIMYRYLAMIKTSNNHRITFPSKLKLNRETLRVIGNQNLVMVVGGASAGVNSAICTVTNLSRDIACCSL